MDLDALTSLVDELRREGSDTTTVEVKCASGGFPDGVLPTLSAFANAPGGGWLVLGLDEAHEFSAVGVYDVAACKAALAAKARQALDPPITFDCWDIPFEGATIVVAKIHELPSHGKPCRVGAHGRAYLRAYDGDYPLSPVEEQALIASRTTPVFDQCPVPGTTVADLRTELMAGYLASCRNMSPLRDLDDDEILYRTGVTVGPQRELSLAGLLAMGIYPQQHMPNFTIQAWVPAGGSGPSAARAIDSQRFDGPIPMMLDDALSWVRRNSRTGIVSGRDGHLRDEPEYPLEAVRELLANAMIHRDLGPHARGFAITLRLEPQKLVVGNPGGLWGISVDRLGKTGVSSARNTYLLRICQNVRTREGRRLVEALASGIPTVLSSLEAAGKVPPRFHDQGIAFTVVVPAHALISPDDRRWLDSLPPARGLNDRQHQVLVSMRHGRTWTHRAFCDAFSVSLASARSELFQLVSEGLATVDGGAGEDDRTYRAATSSSGGSEPDRSGARQPDPDARQEAVVAQLRDRPMTLGELTTATGLTAKQARYVLRKLRDEGRIELNGSPGSRRSTYSLRG